MIIIFTNLNFFVNHLGLNLAMASKSPVSATTNVPEALSCSNDDIFGFLLSDIVILINYYN